MMFLALGCSFYSSTGWVIEFFFITNSVSWWYLCALSVEFWSSTGLCVSPFQCHCVLKLDSESSKSVFLKSCLNYCSSLIFPYMLWNLLWVCVLGGGGGGVGMCARNLIEILTGVFKLVRQCGDNRSLCLNYEMQFSECSSWVRFGGSVFFY